MRKEHCSFWVDVKALPDCLYYEEEFDVTEVLKAIQEGTLCGPDKVYPQVHY